MKKVHLFLLTAVLLGSCKQNKPALNKADSLLVKGHLSKNNRSLSTLKVGETKSISSPIKSLPFGSKILIDFHFPPDWYIAGSASKKEEVIEDTFINAYQFYSELIKRKATIKLPINRLEYIRLNYPYRFLDSITDSTDSIRYQLPNIGPYECYYSQIVAKGFTSDNLEDEKEICSESGNLILYDPHTHNAKVLNVFFKAESFVLEDTRLFYIDKTGSIQIFNCSGDDESVDFKKEFVINVGKNGEVVIKKGQ